MVRAWKAALVAAVLLPLGATAHPMDASGPEELQCGSLSPFSNYCEDLTQGRIGGQPVASAGVLGYAGSVTIRLVRDEPPRAGTVTWVCTAFLTASQAACGPAVWDNVAPDMRVHLECIAGPEPSGLLPASMGPMGPWGCKVLL